MPLEPDTTPLEPSNLTNEICQFERPGCGVYESLQGLDNVITIPNRYDLLKATRLSADTFHGVWKEGWCFRVTKWATFILVAFHLCFLNIIGNGCYMYAFEYSVLMTALHWKTLNSISFRWCCRKLNWSPTCNKASIKAGGGILISGKCPTIYIKSNFICFRLAWELMRRWKIWPILKNKLYKWKCLVSWHESHTNGTHIGSCVGDSMFQTHTQSKALSVP